MKRNIVRSGVILACALLMTASYIAAADEPPKSPSAKWQVATIMQVQAHPLAAGEGASAIRYDVTVRAGNTEYVVLYVPPDGTFKEFVEYHLGLDGLVLVCTDTIKYNDALGRTHELPIISRRTIATKRVENQAQ